MPVVDLPQFLLLKLRAHTPRQRSLAVAGHGKQEISASVRTDVNNSAVSDSPIHPTVLRRRSRVVCWALLAY